MPTNGGDHFTWPTSFMLARSLQSITATPPPQNAANMRLPRITGGPCRVQVCSDGMRIAAHALAVRLLPRQAPDADHLGFQRVADVEGPDHALVPALGIVGQKCQLSLIVDAEAMRAAARHVVEADLARLGRGADVEDEQAGAGVLAGSPFSRSELTYSKSSPTSAQLVHVHARRRLALPDLAGPGGIAHVMGGKALRREARRAADRADIGMALLDLDRLPQPNAADGSWPSKRKFLASSIPADGIRSLPEMSSSQPDAPCPKRRR